MAALVCVFVDVSVHVCLSQRSLFFMWGTALFQRTCLVFFLLRASGLV